MRSMQIKLVPKLFAWDQNEDQMVPKQASNGDNFLPNCYQRYALVVTAACCNYLPDLNVH